MPHDQQLNNNKKQPKRNPIKNKSPISLNTIKKSVKKPSFCGAYRSWSLELYKQQEQKKRTSLKETDNDLIKKNSNKKMKIDPFIFTGRKRLLDKVEDGKGS